jgi:hypothetical protein
VGGGGGWAGVDVLGWGGLVMERGRGSLLLGSLITLHGEAVLGSLFELVELPFGLRMLWA